jgi:hypothetical protein
MKLLCDKCHKEEAIVLLPNNQVRFECGNTRELRDGELKELFRHYGGER